ncbi:MAG: tetratricopeptide repeat protein [Pseudodesulfovibrio sp.]|uniref:tetratricopeptide repeat protein n=1 Tax=Pseudodesulfovibrio sp. TaxID=2035812 RepID=UPI003D0D702C
MGDDFFALHLDTPDAGARTPRPSGWAYMADGVVRCAFSSNRSVKMGMGVNTRTHDSRAFWFLEQTGMETFSARLLGDRHQPKGDARPVSVAELTVEFTPELAYYEEMVIPAMQAKGGRDTAAVLDLNAITGLFGLGLVYVSRNETDRAGKLFAEMAGARTDFEGRNQFLFNDFGIALRKSGQFEASIAFFTRALDFARDDENLFYNLARAHYENDDWTRCMDYLVRSNACNPDLKVAGDLLRLMIGLDEDDRLLRRFGKPPVPPAVAMRARELLAAGSGRVELDESPIGTSVEAGRARSGGVRRDRVGRVDLKPHGRRD